MNGGQGQEDNTLAWVVLGVAVVFGLGVLYAVYRSEINGIALSINHAQLAVAGLVSDQAAGVARALAAREPGSFTGSQVINQFSFVGTYWRWPLSAVLVGLIVWMVTIGDRVGGYRRKFTYEWLIEENTKLFPCMIPVAGRKLLDEPLDSGPWHTPRMGIQFAAEHQLILDGDGKPLKKALLLDKHGLPHLDKEGDQVYDPKGVRIDEKRLAAIFVAQLGGRWSGLDALPDYQYGLAAALMAYGHGDRQDAQQLLDRMSASFAVSYGDDWAQMVADIDIDGAEALIDRYHESEDLQFLERHDTFVNVWFTALYDFARQRGVLTTAQFIWLRPLDPTLFYTLNQWGRPRPWAEAAGPRAHFEAEHEMRRSLLEPEIDTAVDGFVELMRHERWIEGERKGV